MAKYSLRKHEILSGFRRINELFRSELSLFSYPLRLVYIISKPDSIYPGNLLFSVSVPKRNFSKAHIRNLLKRRIRESYRLNKSGLKDHITDDIQIRIMFVYIGKKVENYATIEKAVKKILRELTNKMNATL